MLIDVPSEEQVPATAVVSGLRLFRGLSRFERDAHARGVLRIRPRAPLMPRAEDWLGFEGVFHSDGVRLLHVLEHVREHAVSFSGTLIVAQYYATTAYCTAGLVAEVSLADSPRAVCVAGRPIVHLFTDGTAWLDPRAFIAQTDVWEKNILACETMRHRAQVDDELLLVHGEVQAMSLSVARPARVQGRHVPWKALEQSRGIDMSVMPDLTDDDENDILSVLGAP